MKSRKALLIAGLSMFGIWLATGAAAGADRNHGQLLLLKWDLQSQVGLPDVINSTVQIAQWQCSNFTAVNSIVWLATPELQRVSAGSLGGRWSNGPANEFNNFLTSEFESLLWLSPDKRRLDLVTLTPIGGSKYFLDLTLLGGTRELSGISNARIPFLHFPNRRPLDCSHRHFGLAFSSASVGDGGLPIANLAHRPTLVSAVVWRAGQPAEITGPIRFPNRKTIEARKHWWLRLVIHDESL